MFSNEFSNSKVLQWALGALVFNYFIIFFTWINRSIITVETKESYLFTCPTYFQNCDMFYVLQALPEGYSQTFLYMLFFGVLVWAVYLISEKRWKETQLVLIPLFIWHFLNLFVFASIETSGNYEFYVVGYGIILLFLPHKEFFLKLQLVMYYMLSTSVKIHPAWVEGGYFTNLSLGLPFFPNWSIPIFTNVVIIMEMVGAWFLLSSNKFLQRAALTFFIIFHLYSGILVEYRYPASVFLMVLVVFGPWYRHQPVPLDKKSILGWSFILLLVVLQFIPKFIPGDEKLTLEGNKFGIYMFESNHQCLSQALVHYKDGSEREITIARPVSRHRCTPYIYFLNLKSRCEGDERVESISWTLDHSINGNPFLRIVDEQNVCELEYDGFRHNEWIKSDLDNPKVMGWPVQNYYGGSF